MKEYLKHSRVKGFIGLAAFFILEYVLAPALAIAYIKVTKQDPNESYAALSNASVVIVCAVLLAIIGIIVYINFEELKAQVLLNLKNYRTYLYPIILIFIYVIAFIIMSIVTQSFISDVGQAENQESLDELFGSVNMVLFLAYTVILTPVVEELVFRYSFIKLLDIEKKYLKWIPYLLSAIVFALMHENNFLFNFNIENFIQYCTYLVTSLVLSFGYMATKRNIVSVVFVHISINAFMMIVLILAN